METQRTLVDRMIGAAKLDIPTYEEVEANVALTGQAALVVLIVAVARGIGGSGQGLGGVLAGVIGALVGWLVWAGLTYLIGDKLLGGTATWGELLRTLGYAQAPGVLAVFGVLGILSAPVNLVVGIWLLFTGIVAIRQALDFGTGKAILTAFLGWLVTMVVVLLLGLSMGGLSDLTVAGP